MQKLCCWQQCNKYCFVREKSYGILNLNLQLVKASTIFYCVLCELNLHKIRIYVSYVERVGGFPNTTS